MPSLYINIYPNTICDFGPAEIKNGKHQILLSAGQYYLRPDNFSATGLCSVHHFTAFFCPVYLYVELSMKNGSVSHSPHCLQNLRTRGSPASASLPRGTKTSLRPFSVLACPELMKSVLVLRTERKHFPAQKNTLFSPTYIYQKGRIRFRTRSFLVYRFIPALRSAPRRLRSSASCTALPETPARLHSAHRRRQRLPRCRYRTRSRSHRNPSRARL